MAKVRLSSGRSVTAYIPGIGALIFDPLEMRGWTGEVWIPLVGLYGFGGGRTRRLGLDIGMGWA